MDPITHALSGMIIKQTGFKRQAALPVLIISATAPDIDYITRLWGTGVFLEYHRGITHGILALALFPFIMGLVFKNKGGFFYYYALSFLAYGAHILLDFTNQYGTRILSPLDWSRYALDLTFVIDPYISIGMLSAVVFGRINKKRAAVIAAAAIILIAGYINGRAYFHMQAKKFLKTKVDANIYRVCPLPNGIFRWWFVARSGDEISTGQVDLFMDKVFIYGKYRVDELDSAVIDSKKDRTVKSFLSFARAPLPEVKRSPGRTIVQWKDLSYSFMPGDRFTAEVIMDANGKIIKSDFIF